MNQKISLFWFRRDLRLEDNAGLLKALESGVPVVPIFIFDPNILSKLEDTRDARVSFLHERLQHLKAQLEDLGSDLLVFYDKPLNVFKSLCLQYEVTGLFFNRDYEPYARERDKAVYEYFETISASCIGAKDHVLFEKNEVVKADGTPYLVYSPYAKAWKKRCTSDHFKAYPTQNHFNSFFQMDTKSRMITLDAMGFESTSLAMPSARISKDIISNYDSTRNFPGLKRGTTRLGIHLRFGTISIRALARASEGRNETFLNELIWRDFFQMALYYFPESRSKAIKPKYDLIPWSNNEELFEAWCKGKTGYPIVDAGMRELNATGFMHNRVRMIVASFLTKHLLIDWRWGEAYFAAKLLDFDLASNIGGWQWASGSGLDAAPYFRVFNPTSQMEKFDKDLSYVNKWVPELNTHLYPEPIVEHKWARERCLATYKEALSNA
ncbi:MAG: Deoxyribodipyrimidine photo-lyase [Flavobacteriales bacterium UBA4585]|jgi:deoxyribodipyrimidine photo-lyase|nr:MAG: Deoxyribodipyrimidine photo-lyase [Flavobacteriales bacterium UBA4585]